MPAATPTRVSKAWRTLCALALFWSALAGAHAQVSDYGQKQIGDPVEDKAPSVLNGVTVAQHLNRPLPLQAPFVDETGKHVLLGDYFHTGRPAILALVYYKCPMLCSEELNGLAGALSMVKFNPGRDFDVIVASIDPGETSADAATKKRALMKRYDRAGTEGGWHFLTGPQASIDALTTATGFRYTRTAGPDGRMNQYAHASAIQVVTPHGVIAQYYMGVEYAPTNLRLSLVEAGEGHVGSPVDEILTFCYRYDPTRNTHSLIVARIVQAACLFTLLLLGTYMTFEFRRERRLGTLRAPIRPSQVRG